MAHRFSSGGRQLETWEAACARSFSIGLACLGLACGGSDGDVTRLVPEVQSLSAEGAVSPNVATGPRRPADEAPIVFRSDRAEEGVGDLYLMAPDGSRIRRITTGGDFTVPEWSPDGASIAFRNGVDGVTADVGVVTPDGSPPVMLTQGEPTNALPLPVHWSVDGQKLAYASWPEMGALFVWTMSREGGQSERLLPDVEAQQSTAAWSSPAGLELAYTDHTGLRNGSLWRVNASDLSEPVNLTAGRVYTPVCPRWSPDGTQIAFAGYALLADGSVDGLMGHGGQGYGAPDSEIFVVDVASGEVTRLTDNDAEDECPAWAPDGQSLLISSNRDGDFDLWIVPLDAPDQAENLIDDASVPRRDEMPSWYVAAP